MRVRYAALSVVVTAAVSATAPATAQPPVMHDVRYTVTANAPSFADIYYRDAEPATFSDYSHNPYEFSPRAEVDVAPNRPWVLQTRLANPDLWAMVLVQSGETRMFDTAGFTCELAVDGVVVKTNSGPRGALCSIRNW